MKRLNGLVLAVLFGFAAVASAEEGTAARHRHWAKKHPRRAEVRARQENQAARIKQGVKSGELTHEEAQQLRAEEKQIRQEKREMVANDGKLDRAEYQKLNQDMNKVSKDIYTEKHDAEKR